jgi:hypothetical protein
MKRELKPSDQAVIDMAIRETRAMLEQLDNLLKNAKVLSAKCDGLVRMVADVLGETAGAASEEGK